MAIRLADQAGPFIEAGANEIVALDYAPLISAADPEDSVRRMAELYGHLREMNNIPHPGIVNA